MLRLAEVPRVIGLKDATGNLERGRELLARAPRGFALYSGADATATELMLAGARGTISVSANVAPEAQPGTATTAEDTAVLITLTATDANSDPLTYAIVAAPASGTLSGTPPNVTYTPNLNFNGADSFTFTASDDLLTDITPATVNITVTPVNDAPVATPASWPTMEDTAVAITLTGTDVDLNALTFRITTPPANGTLHEICFAIERALRGHGTGISSLPRDWLTRASPCRAVPCRDGTSTRKSISTARGAPTCH